MATLTEIAYNSRKVIKIGTILTILYIVSRISYALFINWWERTHVPPPPEPDTIYNKLPEIPFPQQIKQSVNFKLETISGTTGEFEDQVKVYLMPAGRTDLFSTERANQLARSLGFLFEPVKLTETRYRWSKDDPFPTILEIDTINENFYFEADWRIRPDLLANLDPPNEPGSIETVKSWFSKFDKLPNDYIKGEQTVEYLKVMGTELVPALSQSEAQIIRVNLTREPVEKIKIWEPHLSKTSLYATYIPNIAIGKQFIEAQFNYYNVDYDHSATYPIISSQTAFNLLKQGKGYYAQFPEGANEISIRNISLGYYDPLVAGFFLQPIFVFEGDGFIGYVRAITDEWIVANE